MPWDTPAPSPRCDSQKCLPIWPNVSWGENCPVENCCLRGLWDCSRCQNPYTAEAHPSVSCSSYTWAEPLFLCAIKVPFDAPSAGEFHCPIQLEENVPLFWIPAYSSRSTLCRFQYICFCCFLTMSPQTTRCFAYHLPWLMAISPFGSQLNYTPRTG